MGTVSEENHWADFWRLYLLEKFFDGPHLIFDVPEEGQQRLAVLMRKYAELPMDPADASLVLLAEHLGHGRILSPDQGDFRTYRWKERKPFENLLV